MKIKKEKTDSKGTNIEERPFSPNDRSEFDHWEGDTLVGGKTRKSQGLFLL